MKVIPRASRNQIDVADDGHLRVRLTASPVDGAANDQLVRMLAERFGVRRSDVVILKGHAGRHKIVKIAMQQTE